MLLPNRTPRFFGNGAAPPADVAGVRRSLLLRYAQLRCFLDDRPATTVNSICSEPPVLWFRNESPRFVGRAARSHVWGDLLDHAFDARGRTALLVGAPGIGKTRLAGETMAKAQDRGALVLDAARCEVSLLRVGPLSAPESLALARDFWDSPLEPHVVARRAHGNPFAVLELSKGAGQGAVRTRGVPPRGGLRALARPACKLVRQHPQRWGMQTLSRKLLRSARMCRHRRAPGRPQRSSGTRRRSSDAARHDLMRRRRFRGRIRSTRTRRRDVRK